MARFVAWVDYSVNGGKESLTGFLPLEDDEAPDMPTPDEIKAAKDKVNERNRLKAQLNNKQ